MKLSLSTFTLTALLAALPLAAQETAPPKPATPPPAAGAPAAAPPPATPAPGQPAAQPGLLPPPSTPAPAPVPDGFKTDKERQSYALGLSFANNLKQEEQNRGTPLPKVDDLLKGVSDVLSGAKPLDYVIGAHLGSQIRRSEVDIDVESLSLALRESLSNGTPKLNPQQIKEAMDRLNAELAKKREEKRQLENAKTLEASNKFLESNAKAEGVKQTASGLQYTVLKAGEGKSPTETDLVTINFKSTTLDGNLVEKSPDTGPARKIIKSLPKGLQEGLALLKTGSKAKFWLSPALGFGDQGRLGLIKTNSIVVYEVELLGVEPAPKPGAALKAAAAANGQPPRQPVTAVTPPITVEIPPRPGTDAPPARPIVPAKPGEVKPPAAPPGATPPVPNGKPPVPPPAPPPPAPPASPDKK
jgi:FKBP-type peptidyl-prolyl cis-trans isomerase